MSDMREPFSRFIETEKGRLHFVTHGSPSAPPMVLVHGMRDHARSWDWIAEAFSDQYFVIAPNLRGHGDSFWSEAGAYTVASFVMDLADLIDTLGLPSVTMVGHSLGGNIALRYTGIFPDRVESLCIIEGIEMPLIRDQRENPKTFPVRMRGWIEAERDRRRREPRLYPTIAAAELRMVAEHPGFDAATIAHLVQNGMVQQCDGGWRWKYDNAARFRAPEDVAGKDLDEILSAISCPTLLLYAEDSWITKPPPNRLALIRNHQIETFPGVGHWLHHQARSKFIAALAAFLNQNSRVNTDA